MSFIDAATVTRTGRRVTFTVVHDDGSSSIEDRRSLRVYYPHLYFKWSTTDAIAPSTADVLGSTPLLKTADVHETDGLDLLYSAASQEYISTSPSYSPISPSYYPTAPPYTPSI